MVKALPVDIRDRKRDEEPMRGTNDVSDAILIDVGNAVETNRSLIQPTVSSINTTESKVDVVSETKIRELRTKLDVDLAILVVLRRIREAVKSGADYSNDSREAEFLMSDKDRALFNIEKLGVTINRIASRYRGRLKALDKLEAST